MKQYVLDACAVLRLLQNEKGADKIESILELAQKKKAHCSLHMINFGEVIYLIAKRYGVEIAARKREEIPLLPITMVNFKENLFWKAVEIKSQFAMSYAGSFAAALAIEQQAILLTSDPEFKVVADKLSLELV